MNKDTIELLEQCNAGVKMAVTAIDDVLPSVSSQALQQKLESSKQLHQRLGSQTHQLLNSADEGGKSPGAMARSMSWIKTNVKLTLDPSDQTVADLMMDGCNMGIKSLIRYKNQYVAASRSAMEIAEELIHAEEQLASELRPYL